MEYTFEDLWFYVKATPGEHRVHYEIYDIEGIGDGDTDHLLSEEPLITGHVKWDGCSDWDFHTDHVLWHECDREGLVRIGAVLARCWDLTETLCGNWLV